MAIQELMEKLIVNIAVLALAAELISRLHPVQKAILNERRRFREDLMLSVIFGGLSILSTCMGVNIGSYSLSTRIIGVMAAGLLGGPLVGFLASLIGSGFVLLFSVPKVFARSSAFSTLLCGLLGAGFYPYFQRGKWKYRDLFVLACFGEIVDMVCLMRITVSLQVVMSAILDAAVPMILINAVGILIFISCFNTVFIRQDLESSRQLRQMLDLTRKCVPLLEDGLEIRENMEKLVDLAAMDTNWSAVMVADKNKILAWNVASDLDIKNPVVRTEEEKEIWKNLGFSEDVWRSSRELRQVLKQAKPEANRSKEEEEMLHALSCLWDIPQVGQRAMKSGEMAVENYTPVNQNWFYAMRDCTAAASPFVMEEQAIGCLIVYVKRQWLARQSERDLLENLTTVGSYQIALKELEKRKLMLQQAEFKALQFQVNPHFLFNALNTIASVCREDAGRARELLITLADYFRYNLDYGAVMVPLSEELDHVKDYLELERARFEDKLIVSYETPARMDIMIPTLILQPIVENAVRHGISPDGRRIVDIRIREEEEAYVVSVSDRGRGFPEEVLRKLELDDPIENHIGLSNVHKRMKSIYGEEHGLKIDSSPQGSCVTLCFYKV